LVWWRLLHNTDQLGSGQFRPVSSFALRRPRGTAPKATTAALGNLVKMGHRPAGHRAAAQRQRDGAVRAECEAQGRPPTVSCRIPNAPQHTRLTLDEGGFTAAWAGEVILLDHENKSLYQCLNFSRRIHSPTQSPVAVALAKFGAHVPPLRLTRNQLRARRRSKQRRKRIQSGTASSAVKVQPAWQHPGSPGAAALAPHVSATLAAERLAQGHRSDS